MNRTACFLLWAFFALWVLPVPVLAQEVEPGTPSPDADSPQPAPKDSPDGETTRPSKDSGPSSGESVTEKSGTLVPAEEAKKPAPEVHKTPVEKDPRLDVLQSGTLEKIAEVLDVPQSRLQDAESVVSLRVSLQHREERSLEEEKECLRKADRLQKNEARLLTGLKTLQDTRRELKRLKELDASSEPRNVDPTQPQDPKEEAPPSAPDPELEALEGLLKDTRTSARENAARLREVQKEIKFLDTSLEFLDTHHNKLIERAKERDNLARKAAKNRELARKEQERTAEAKQEIQEELARAEAEALKSRREAAEREEASQKIFQELVERETRLLAEKFYVLDRRDREFAQDLKDLSKLASDFRLSRTRIQNQIEGLQKKFEEREKLSEQRNSARTLFWELDERGRKARAEIIALRYPMKMVSDLLEGVKREKIAQNTVVRDARDAYTNDHNDKNKRKVFRIAEIEGELLDSRLQLLSNRLQVLSSNYELAYEDLSLSKEFRRDLLPILSESDQDGLRSLDEDNAGRLLDEWQDFWIATRFQLGLWLRRARGFDGEKLSFSDVFWFLKASLLLLFLLAVLRYVRANKPTIFEWVQSTVVRMRLRRKSARFALKLIEIAETVAVPAVLMFSINVFLGLFAEDAPLVVLVRVLSGSALVYLMAIGGIKALVLPRWYREKRTEETHDLPEASGALLDMDLQRALFFVSTLRMLLLYTLICQYSLFLVRRAFGMFFIGYWAHILGYLGYVVVIYMLLSRWKEVIAQQFERILLQRLEKEGEEPPDLAKKEQVVNAVNFVNTHKDKIYGVLVIFGAFVYIYAQEGIKFAERYGRNTEAMRKIQNFLFRKQLEFSADRQAQEGMELQKLPETYKVLFSESATTPPVIPRTQELERIKEVYKAWYQDENEGALAIVGESGIGKSMLLEQVESIWMEEHAVYKGSAEDKILTEEGVLAFLSDFVKLERVATSVEDFVEMLSHRSPCVIILDNADNLFLRSIDGLDAMEILQRIILLSTPQHFWLTTFNSFAWAYINRFGDRDQPLSEDLTLSPWSDEDIRSLIESRHDQSGLVVNFDALQLERDLDEVDAGYESVRSVRGYFRLLTEFARGNPEVALSYWLKSLSMTEDQQLHVSLFQTRLQGPASRLGDRMKFALAAIILHKGLTVEELARVNNTDERSAGLAINYLEGIRVLDRDAETQRLFVKPHLFRQILQNLLDNNLLYH